MVQNLAAVLGNQEKNPFNKTECTDIAILISLTSCKVC